MRILFLGAGAVGGYFGGRLTAAGTDVTFLVRSGRAQQLRDGLKITSPLGDATIPVTLLQEGESADPFDLIVLTCKAYGLDGALEAIAPHVRQGTVIMPLLNGLAHLARIEARFPEAAVWAGIAGIPAHLGPDGTIEHKGKLHNVTVGPRPGQESTRPLADAFVAALHHAGMDTACVTETPMQALWDKWTFLCTLAATTCLMRGDVGQILATDHGERLVLGLLDECTAVAEAEGQRPGDRQMAGYRKMLTDRGSHWTASMRHDLEHGNPTEADHIIGEMIRLADRHGIATPLLGVALSHLQVYENARA